MNRSLTMTSQIAEDPNFISIEVEDTGVGIPADKIEAVWGAFQQVPADRRRSMRDGGGGLA